MVERITIEQALGLQKQLTIIDVRTPAEFEQGHIPGAVNIPLFSNEERAKVGTIYKQQSKEQAINLGMKYVKPKLEHYITESVRVANGSEVIVHCWRGGMRSGSFAQHLSDHGFSKVYVIEGGYKTFRNLVLAFFEKPIKLKVLGGYTGSGKTDILQSLKNLGEQIIDLEFFANHRGSAFGSYGLGKQPTAEYFENMVYIEFQKLDLNKFIWVEDESHHIGSVFVPHALFLQMESANLMFAEVPLELRAEYLVETYGKLNKTDLAEGVSKISNRLGFDRAKVALTKLDEGNLFETAKITLEYYDKYYTKGLSRRNPDRIIRIPLNSCNANENAIKLLELSYKYEPIN